MDQKEHEDQKENGAVAQEEGPSPSQGGLRPPEERERWHRMRPQEVLAKVSASLSGLTQAEAQKRLGQYGRNELERKKGLGVWDCLLSVQRNIL
jgi:magnesium-transporting ATPase (P-type)